MPLGPPASTAPAFSLPYTQSIDGCLEDAIGRHGLSPADLAPYLAQAEAEVARLRDEAVHERLPLLAIVDARDDIARARTALDHLSRGARTIVFFGTGGSSLGGQTLAQLAGWNIPGTMDKAQRSRARTRIYDNLDPETLGRALASGDLPSTRFVVISKSGNTPETLVQALHAFARVDQAGLASEIPHMFLGLTEPAVMGRKNGLRALLEARGAPILDHHPEIGGRYSVLTNVGLLPGLARGLDAVRLRTGARLVVDAVRKGRGAADVPPALGAAVALALAAERGIRVQVMMPYADRLGRFAHWFVQLWAESLGKGGRGTTPVACLGPLDQHSQLQLFMDGPRDHLLTLVRTQSAGTGPAIDAELALTAGLPEMAGRHAGDLTRAQAFAVPDALARAGRPVRTFDIAVVDETTVGALLMHFMLETIIAGRMLGVDPFDQPAVELGKMLARERLIGSP
jgi:glucose-6-phosphate isomerase